MWTAIIVFMYLNGAGLSKELTVTSKTEFKTQKECIVNASKTAADMVKITTDTVIVASFTCAKANTI